MRNEQGKHFPWVLLFRPARDPGRLMRSSLRRLSRSLQPVVEVGGGDEAV